MPSLKDEFVRGIMISLKLENNPFIISTVDEYVSHIAVSNYKPFMKELFGTQHAFLNGLDRVSKVAEQFKPVDTELVARAKRIIHFTESLSSQVQDEAKEAGKPFELMVRCLKLPTKYNKTLAVLELVKPYRNAKDLIINIRRYQTSSEAINAFKQAIIEFETMPQTDLVSHKVTKLLQPANVYYDNTPRENPNVI